MGQGLARNFQRNGWRVVLHDPFAGQKLVHFVESSDVEPKFQIASDIQSMLQTLPRPRTIMMMVPDALPNGVKPPDEVLKQLLPHLEAGDVVIDGANSYFEDTERRISEASKRGVYFIGMGVSGGEKGALRGPSLMPSGPVAGWELARDLLTAASAKTPDGSPMVAYIGPGGAGHFVKMVHNGIEYAELQLLAEIYDVLSVEGFSVKEFAEMFREWSKDPQADSFLVRGAAKVFGRGDNMIDRIEDYSKQLGTGRYTVEMAMRLGVPAPTIAVSVMERFFSTRQDLRKFLHLRLNSRSQLGREIVTTTADYKALLKDFAKKTFVFSRLMAFSQGFEIIKAASDKYSWNINLCSVAGIWRAGCILQSPELDQMMKALSGSQEFEGKLITSQLVAARFVEARAFIEDFLDKAHHLRVPTPALTSALHYFRSYTSNRLPLNLVAALRDYFGAHKVFLDGKIGDGQAEHIIWED